MKAQALAAYTAASPMLARLAKEEFVKRFERELPGATACFLDDFEACIASATAERTSEGDSHH